EKVAKVLFTLGSELQLPWLSDQINSLPALTQWQALAREAYRDQLENQLSALTISVLQTGQTTASAAELVSAWLEDNQAAMARWQKLVAELRAAGPSDYPMMAVATRELTDLPGTVDR